MAITVVNLTDTFDEWRVKTNAVHELAGDLTTLSTTAKGTLVAAINELDGESHLANVVEDTSPQLGGDLVLNGEDITGTGNIITTGNLTLSGTGIVSANNFTGSAPNITSTVSSNGDITISPDGTGDINLETDRVKLGSAGEDVVVTTNGSGTLTIGTNNATASTTPLIVLENGGNILLNCVSGQPVIIDGDVQATSFSGDLRGTINTATTGTTQSASNNSTLIATTAYVDAQVATEDTIAEMNDTTISSSANLDLLQYNSSTSKWVNTSSLAVIVGGLQSTSNGNITITPDGTGDVNLETDKVKIGSAGEDVVVTTNGSGSLTIGPNDATTVSTPVITLENNGRILLNCASGQAVVVDGDVQATSYAGALVSTVTGTTQSASNNSTLIATTAYVDAQVATEDTIAEMNDTTISSSANLDLLQYNSSTSKWVNTAIGAVVGATQSASNNSTLLATTAYVDAQVATENTIDEMDDTTISNPQNLDVLQYTGSVWENQVLAAVTADEATALAIALG